MSELYPCPNKSHWFQLRRFYISWTWAKEYWAHTVNDSIQNIWLDLKYTTSKDDYRISTIIWKLSLKIGIMKND